MTESRHFHCIALSRVGEVSVLGIFQAKGLALILAVEHKGDLLGAMEKYREAVDLDPTGYGFRLKLCAGIVQDRKMAGGDHPIARSSKGRPG
jgi:hypothetical protein